MHTSDHVNTSYSHEGKQASLVLEFISVNYPIKYFTLP